MIEESVRSKQLSITEKESYFTKLKHAEVIFQYMQQIDSVENYLHLKSSMHTVNYNLIKGKINLLDIGL